MEEEEQDIIEVDKSLLAGNFNRDKSKKRSVIIAVPNPLAKEIKQRYGSMAARAT